MSGDEIESLKRHAKFGGRWPANTPYEKWRNAFEQAQKEAMEHLSRKWAWSRKAPRLKLICTTREDGEKHD